MKKASQHSPNPSYADVFTPKGHVVIGPSSLGIAELGDQSPCNTSRMQSQHFLPG